MNALGNRYVRLLLRFVLAAIAIALVVWRLDVSEAFQRFTEADFRWILPAAGLFALSRVLFAYRWRMFMPERRDLPLPTLTGILFMSNMVNILVPARAGDVLRIELTHRRLDIERSELASNVMATETLVDSVAFVLLMLVLLPFLNLPFIGAAEATTIGVVVAATLFGAVRLARVDTGRDFSHVRPIRSLPASLQQRAADWLPGILNGLASLRSSKRFGGVLALTFLLRLLEAAAYWMIGVAFGLPLGPADYVAVMVVIGIVLAIPLFPNVGPYEIAVAESAVLFGATRGDASAYAIGSHVVLVLWAVASGLAAMWLMRLRPRNLK